MSIALKKESTFGAVLLVAGCCIGAATIGLPVVSVVSGFFPSSLMMFFSYLFTTGMGLLLLEATLWFEHKVNLLSIAQFTLGRLGKTITGALFLFLFYGIFVAYLDAGGQLLEQALGVPKQAAMCLCVILVSATIYKGVRSVDLINRILMAGLLLSYLLLVTMGLSDMQLKNLEHKNWLASLGTLPILFICFGYQNLVPSLACYLQKNIQQIRTAIILGNMIPFLFYLLWNFVVLGMISDPRSNLDRSTIVTDLLIQANQSKSIIYLVNIFSLFGLFTSFITIGISFIDFIKDAFKSPPSKLVLHSLVLLPPLFICFIYSDLFLLALNFAGGFIDILLFGMLPISFVWIGRYKKGAQGSYQVKGGKGFLIIMLLLCITLIAIRLF
ncbi:MAG: aromatic amino acid transport family protein [Chlamydiota bacterium]